MPRRTPKERKSVTLNDIQVTQAGQTFVVLRKVLILRSDSTSGLLPSKWKNPATFVEIMSHYIVALDGRCFCLYAK